MEKFSKWRDPGTGIAPFLPVSGGYGKSGAVVVAETVLKLALVTVKLPLVIVALVLHLALGWTGEKITLRLLLLLCGVTSIKIEDRKNARRPTSGDVIVSNHTSPLDPLIYSCLFDCIFVLPTGDKSDAYTTVSTIELMRNAMSLPDKRREVESFEKIVKRGKVVVLFPEGTSSNGRGLLSVPTIPVSSVPSAKFYPAAAKYNPQINVITAIPTSPLVWVWQLLGSFVGSTIKLAVPVASTGNDEAVTNEIAEGICRAGRLRRVGGYLNAEAKREFYQAWKRYH